MTDSEEDIKKKVQSDKKDANIKLEATKSKLKKDKVVKKVEPTLAPKGVGGRFIEIGGGKRIPASET